MYLFAKAGDGYAEDAVVVERQRRNGIQREPSGLGGIISSGDRAFLDEGEVCNCDDPFARIAVDIGECAELLYV